MSNRHKVSTPQNADSYTVAEVMARCRVGQAKVHGWIRSGELKAVNVASRLGARPQWVIPAEALEEFLNRRSSAPAPKPARRKRKAAGVDFYPD